MAAGLVAGCATPNGPVETPTTSAPQAAGNLSPVTLQIPDGLNQAPLDTTRQVLIPAGWKMSVWARIPKARLAAWTPDGALLVSVPATGDIVRLKPDGHGGPPQQSVLISGLHGPHGLAFAGSRLYVGENDKISSYLYTDGKLTKHEVVVPDLPNRSSSELRGEYEHDLKSVAVGPDGAVYFSIGSTGNISVSDRVATPQRATIMRIPPDGGAFTVFARGVRNGTGLAIAPDGSVWTAVNGRDNIAYPFRRPYGDAGASSFDQVIQAYVNDHPAEILARLTAGRDLGWPYCNPDGDENPGVAGSPQRTADVPLVRDAQTNEDGTKLDCTLLRPIERTLGAHAAPLGLSFVNGGLAEPFAQGALVGVHGSWNREPPQAPEVAFFPWENGTLGEHQTLVGGFQGDDGSRWGRPVAAVAGPDRAVYVTDDYAGAVYRLEPPNS